MKFPSWIQKPSLAAVTILGCLVLAGGSGFLASQALGIGAQAPTKTTTITLTNGATGPTGPAGPSGPKGDPGAESCPTGSNFEAVTIDHPGGHITLWACVAQ